MVDACYNIVRSINLSMKICQMINNSVFSFSISIDVNKKRKRKSPSQKEKKKGIYQKEDAKKSPTVDESEATNKCGNPTIVPGKYVSDN